MAYQILLADDEAEIRDLLRLYLENEHYKILEAADGEEALRLFSTQTIDLCLLDVMMPKIDGFHVLKKIRESSNVPVLMLSAKREDADKILGLNLGADDYLAKPFNPLEAVARVNSAIRRFHTLGSIADAAADSAMSTAASAASASRISTSFETSGSGTVESGNFLTVRDLTLDLDGCLLSRGEDVIPLSSVEYRIMELFMRYPGKVFTKQQLFEAGWEEDYIVSDNNIMVCISKLRSKLDEDPMKYIKTIRGLGYRLEKK